MSTGLHRFDALYVISDLHLGDDPSRSMFQDTERLADFIRHVSVQRPAERVGLVLNGDVVDFLSGPSGAAFDPEHAAERLAKIAKDFSPVFEALRSFTATARRRLVITLGNHDIELALPAVTETLLSLVCEREEDRGRVLLSLDGAGLRCEVGGRSVFIVHGNDSDGWNVVDHEALRETAAAMNMGAKLPSWTSNAGTTLVVEVLNRVKAAHPWIELLKPEGLDLAMLLLAIDPSQKTHATKAFRIAAKRAAGEIRVRFLGDEGEVVERREPRARTSPEAERAAIAAAIADVDRGVRPTEFVSDESLSWWPTILDRSEGRPRLSRVREELKRWLGEESDSFALTHTSSDDRAFIANVSPDVDVVVAGHTHVARAQPRVAPQRVADGVPWYFNSGTWIALVSIDLALLESDRDFAPVWEMLAGSPRTIRALIEQCPQVVRRAASAVRIETRGAKVRGELLHFPTTGDAPVARSIGACEFDVKAGG